MNRRLRAATVAALGFVVALGASACSAADGDDELSVDEYCERVIEVRVLDDQLGQIETLELQETYDELDALAASAPAEIQPSLRILADYVGDVVDVMDDVRPGDTEGAADALASVTSPEQSASIEESGREVESYTQTNCLYDLRSGGTMPPATSSPESTLSPESTPPPETGPPTTG